ncbi:hypothetical protein EYZ11_012835 [Aspergillus tanneri]|uniref:Uncharacterized protein n=1 Tax=Aspergillus tanneri TaxID=1220188 RepID=A0A4S3IZ78_9EURO|nr:hypothetical protein EYZ11_012835 [Aspergillus tanneri]
MWGTLQSKNRTLLLKS